MLNITAKSWVAISLTLAISASAFADDIETPRLYIPNEGETTAPSIQGRGIPLFKGVFQYNTNDPYLADQNYMEAAGNGLHNLDSAKAIANKNVDMRIAVIDGGFWRHEDMIWTGGSAVTPDITQTGEFQYESDYSRIFSKENCSDSHGTAVAGIIGAISDNGVGIQGIANATYIPIRAGGCRASSGFIPAIGHVANLGDSEDKYYTGGLMYDFSDYIDVEEVDIIHMSLGLNRGCTEFMQDQITDARAKGIWVIVAAGNEQGDIDTAGDEGGEVGPSGCDDVVAVASVNDQGIPSWFTNYGPRVDISAIGEQVLTICFEDQYCYYDGTSFSAPIVTGVATLVRQEFPTLEQQTFENLLKLTSKPYGGFDERSPCSGSQCGPGILDAEAVVRQAQILFGAESPTVANPLEATYRQDKASAYAQFNSITGACSKSEVVIPESVFEYSGRYVKLYSSADADFTDGELSEVGTSQLPETVVSAFDNSLFYGYQVCSNDDGCFGEILTIAEVDTTEPASCSI